MTLDRTQTEGIAFIDAPAGTGKTLLLNTICDKLRVEGKQFSVQRRVELLRNY